MPAVKSALRTAARNLRLPMIVGNLPPDLTYIHELADKGPVCVADAGAPGSLIALIHTSLEQHAAHQ